MKISIVMPSFNQAPFLAQSLRSVREQAGDFELEVIVVDGGSTDGSVAILESIGDDRVAWTSEPDRGQAHAVNKGFARATGDVVGWLNSDDAYPPGALAAVAGAFASDDDPDWVVGRCAIVDEDDRVIRGPISRYKDRRLARYSYRALLRENFISQMAVFWRRGFGEDVGPLDETLFYTMDYDLWCRMGRRRDPMVLDRVIAHFRFHGGSKSGAVDRRQFDEEYAVALRYLERDHLSRVIHRFHVEKTVWSYRLMRLMRRFRPAARS